MITYHGSITEHIGGESFFDEIFGGLNDGGGVDKKDCECALSGDDTDSVDLYSNTNVADDSSEASGIDLDEDERDGGAEDETSEFIDYADAEAEVEPSEFIDYAEADAEAEDETSEFIDYAEAEADAETVGGDEISKHISEIFGIETDAPTSVDETSVEERSEFIQTASAKTEEEKLAPAISISEGVSPYIVSEAPDAVPEVAPDTAVADASADATGGDSGAASIDMVQEIVGGMLNLF